jgi:flavin-dependent dehydrogenase
LVGSKIFDEDGPLKVPSSSIINTINGAVIHCDGDYFTVERKGVACVVDRERFDKELSNGLEILYQNRFLGLEKDSSAYIIETDKEEVEGDIVVGADGANSAVRKTLGQEAGLKYYKGIQLRMKMRPAHKDMVEVYLKHPSFFWIVPESESVVRFGTISDNPYKDLQSFLKESRMKGEILEKFGGIIAIGGGFDTVKGNVALVGDAACQLKPLTYGGIYFGLKAASILASCIRRERLKDYDRLWKKELDFEIRIGLKAKEIYARLNPEELKKIFKLVKRHKAIIEKVGDFDNHSRAIVEILKKPTLYPQISDLLQIFFRKLL